METFAEPRPHPRVGTQLVRVWRPATEPQGEVVLVHGISEHTGRYQRVGHLLSKAGFSVTGADLVGWGATGGRRGDVRDWADYLDQVQELVEEAKKTGRPTILLGHSMGGLIALEYTVSDRPAPDLLVVSAPSLRGGARWQRLLGSALGRVLPAVTAPAAVRGDQLSRDPTVGEEYARDPLVYQAATFRFGRLFFDAMTRTRDACARLQVPALVLHGGEDSLVPPTCTAELGSLSMVERRFYPRLRHEIFNEPEGEAVIAEVVDWISSRLT